MQIVRVYGPGFGALALSVLLLTLVACECRVCAEHDGKQPANPNGEQALGLVLPEFRGNAETTREAVAGWVSKGEAAIPSLKEGLEDENAKVRRACREALAKITGQWGWDEGLKWRRSMAEAKVDAEKSGLPIMLLQLFGRFDEEFC
ncbi:MAG: hypothetical protein V3W41_02775 [Planctomycetota bacterium]